MIGRTNSVSGSGAFGFIYDGLCKFFDEGNGNWHIELYESGNMRFSSLGALAAVDAFLVGGGGAGGQYTSANSWQYGGGGGCGGVAETFKEIPVNAYDSYPVVIGDGGIYNGTGDERNGKASTAFGFSVPGGSGVTARTIPDDAVGAKGGAGASGAAQGKAGSDGEKRAFDSTDESLPLYGPGGGGGGGAREDTQGHVYSYNGGAGGATNGANGGRGTAENKTSGVVGENGKANTGSGGGGGGSGKHGGNGGSGIVIIRNHRQEETL